MMKSFSVAGGLVALAIGVIFGLGPTAAGAVLSKSAARTAVVRIAPPAAMAQLGIEGWARVCHSVGSDGAVADIRVLDVSPRPEFAAAARKEVAAWIYEPAGIEGEAVEEHDVCELVVFQLAGEEEPNGKATDSQLEEVERLIESIDPADPEANAAQAAADLVSAGKILDALEGKGPLDLRQGTRSQLLRYRIAVREKNEAGALLALERATVGEARFVEEEDFIAALGAQFTGLAQQGRYREALELFARFEVLDGGALPMVVHGKAASSIRDLAASENSFAVPAKLVRQLDGDSGVWHYRPLRRELGVRKLDGKLAAVVVECERRKIRLEYQEEVSWGIPESWGDCTVYAEGDVGTTFELIEFAAAAPQAEPAKADAPQAESARGEAAPAAPTEPTAGEAPSSAAAPASSGQAAQ